jgi:FKBP-type peptidyl-prolyl cis-trans isomerase 2
MNTKAKYGDAVTLHFTCTLEDGTIFDTSTGKEPLQLRIGEGQVIEALEEAIIGMSPGEMKTAKIPYARAYDAYRNELVQTIPRDQFPGFTQPEVGMEFRVEQQDGETRTIKVTEVTDSSVTLDANHPLAGKDLTFDIQLLEIIHSGPNANAYYNLGMILQNQGHIDEALQHYQKAVQVDPEFLNGYFILGCIYQGNKQFAAAIKNYEKVLEINPDHLQTLNNLGNIYRQRGDYDESLKHHMKALEIDSGHADTYNNLGVLSQEKGDMDEAIQYYLKATALNDNFPEAYNNLGMAYKEKGNIDKAEDCFQQAIYLEKDFAEAHVNLSFVNLLQGNYEEGWKEYEWRLQIEDFQKCYFDQPLWDGGTISGKKILVHTEQGVGDTIQFIRYIPLLAQQGAYIIVLCQNELKSLLLGTEGLVQVVGFGESMPDFDIHCPLLSLPLRFGTTIESILQNIPYIKTEYSLIQKWEQKIQHDRERLRVGLVWAGDPNYKKDLSRSCPLEIFLPLLQNNNFQFYSLQKGPAASQIKNLPRNLFIHDYTDDIHDFADTAALIENLDLIISVDTAVAHLAGALGKSVWTLLPFAPDWRWMLDREDSPWYPTMRLFRQISAGDWASVITAVANALEKFKTSR